MKVYVSGPMSGLPLLNYPAFRAATSRLRAAGVEVVCPTEVAAQQPMESRWEDFLREDLRHLLDVDAVVCLPGWMRSRGARLECFVAAELGLPLYSIDELLEEIAA